MPESHKTYHRRKMSPLERFSDSYAVDPISRCWNWKRGLRGHGYAAFWFNRQPIKASRMAYLLFKGLIPEGLYVCHHCDNRLCVNPDHLFLGTAKDNMQDMIKKGRQVTPRGEQAHHKLTTQQVLDIKSSALSGAELARLYKVGPMQISRIRRGLRWGHVNSNAS